MIDMNKVLHLGVVQIPKSWGKAPVRVIELLLCPYLHGWKSCERTCRGLFYSTLHGWSGNTAHSGTVTAEYPEADPHGLRDTRSRRSRSEQDLIQCWMRARLD